MRLLIDTNVVIRFAQGRPLAPAGIEALTAADDVFVSAIVYAEVAIKASIGKLRMDGDLRQTLGAVGARDLNLTPAHAMALADLPFHHRDPFDRLIVAQARVEGLVILTADEQLTAYDVPVVLA